MSGPQEKMKETKAHHAADADALVVATHGHAARTVLAHLTHAVEAGTLPCTAQSHTHAGEHKHSRDRGEGRERIHLSGAVVELIPLRDQATVELIILPTHNIRLGDGMHCRPKMPAVCTAGMFHLRRIPIAAGMIPIYGHNQSTRMLATTKLNIRKIRSTVANRLTLATSHRRGTALSTGTQKGPAGSTQSFELSRLFMR